MEKEGLMELPYEYDALTPHISKKVLEWHHDTHHQGYVNGMNTAEEKLEKQREDGDFSSTGSLLRDYTHNFSGNVLHNLFWKNMSPNGGGMPEGELLERIEEEFGSYENWKNEFIAAAKSASGWALLVYVPYTNSLHNVAVDKHDQNAIWGAQPLLAVDVWEHSYYHDYGPDRAEFINSFFEVVDWEEPQERYSKFTELFE
ncbi:superoxide dismutase [Candidatus Nanohalococcus occultus]|uniref:Superoxide dismutase n=1 Tax=Candidatus Nanohalococcus occultus TaxID=2978047 RepID=A0ABY8CE93_9ARCH|nr:Superoxide dismutase [Candidatus Nanohaloarchaeota archaeon SVXNc]